MLGQLKVVAFDVDQGSLTSLREAFPNAVIETQDGASTRSLTQDWNPAVADLLVIGANDHVNETLGLCRGLRSQAGRAHISLLVLVPRVQPGLVEAALHAGADSCLVLPVHAKELRSMVARTRADTPDGRHTLDLDQPTRRDEWRDEGGEA